MHLLQRAIHRSSSPHYNGSSLGVTRVVLDDTQRGHPPTLSAIPSLSSLSDNSLLALRTASARPSTLNNPLSTTNLNHVSDETQPVMKLTEMTLTVHDGLTGTRAAVVGDAGPTLPEIPIELFCQFLLPRPAVIDHLDAILADLEKRPGRWGAYNRKAQRWRAFPLNPRDAGLHEDKVFANLKKVGDAVSLVAQAYDGGKTPSARFDQDPTHAPVADWRTTGVKPDGYFLLRAPRCAGPPTHWMDIAATGEYKRDDREGRNLEDDSKKVLYNMYHTLREDPRRRFTYGFTIENCTMRVWFGGRADIFVSTPFDFMAEHAYLVQFFLALTYAEEHELGWDPTIEYFPPAGNKAAFYVYEVHFKNDKDEDEVARFKTIKMLSNIGAHALRGRGTRVWKVRRWVDGEEVGDAMVLKDCWIDSDRKREGDIMTAILADAKGTEHEAVIKRALLTTIMHGNVQIAGTTDNTLVEARRKEITESGGWFLFHRTQVKHKKFAELCGKVNSKVRPTGSHSGLYDAIRSEPELKPITYSPKTHYRIVFKELCNPLYSEVHLMNVCEALFNLTLVLQSLHAIGWVHRDISAGNVLILDGAPHTIKLADFEYSKRIGESTGGKHEIRTGTVDFMSVEVDTMEYHFQPEEDQGVMNYDADTTNAFSLDRKRAIHYKEDTANSQQSKTQEQAWFYSPIHDLESLFWLFVYFVLYRDIQLLAVRPQRHRSLRRETGMLATSGAIANPDNLESLPDDLRETEEERVERIKAQFNFAKGLFVERDKRLATLNVNQRMKDFLGAHPLHPALRKCVDVANQRSDSRGVHFSLLLIEARNLMKKFYRDIEQDLSSLPAARHTIGDGLHWRLRTIFISAIDCLTPIQNDWHVCLRSLSEQYWTLVGRNDAAEKVPLELSQGGTKRKHDELATITEEETEIAVEIAPEPPKKRATRASRTTTKNKKRAAAAEDGEYEQGVRMPRKAARRKQDERSVHDAAGDVELGGAGKSAGIKPRTARATRAPAPTTRLLRSRAQGVDSLGRTRASTRRAQT